MLLANPSPCSRCPLFFPFHSHGSSHGSLPPSPLRSLSHHPFLFLSLPSTHLQPRGATNLCCLCCHSLCLFRLSAFPSHYFHQLLLSISLSLSALCSEAAAPRAGLQRYDRERPQILAQAHSDTPTPTFLASLSPSGFSNNLGCFSESVCPLNLKGSDPAPHNIQIKTLFQKMLGCHYNQNKKELAASVAIEKVFTVLLMRTTKDFINQTDLWDVQRAKLD